MAVTATALNPQTFGWVVNATSADASSCETVKAAPGAGVQLVLKQITVICDSNITVTIGSGESSNNVEAVLLGPIPFGSAGGSAPNLLSKPILLPANKALTVDASGAGNVCVIAEGDLK